jgi:hypothetical protein
MTQWLMVLLPFFFSAFSAGAAPLDALISALPEKVGHGGYLEVGSDHMTGQLDFFKIRDSNALAAGTQAGDYQGAHIAGVWLVRDNTWLSGSLWKRSINGLSETYDFNSWQVSGMYRFLEADGKIPAVGVRLSAWGNSAGEIGATNLCTAPVANAPTTCQPNAFLNTVKIADPADKNLQVDLIGTWKVAPTTDVSVLVSTGITQLSYGELSATTTRNGLDYKLSFIGNDIFGTTADGSSQFRDKGSKYGVDVTKELAWRGNFLQTGVSAAWRHGPWTLRGGYLFYAIQREAVDDILKARGWSSVTQCQNILVEANYRLHSGVSAFVRGHFSNSLIFNDIPVIYNSFSSDLVGGRYSVYTLGLRADF